MTARPTPDEQTVLETLADGHAPVNETWFLRAMFACISRGWVDHGRVTVRGRAALDEARQPMRGVFYEVIDLQLWRKDAR